jgi:hypothetical protein
MKLLYRREKLQMPYSHLSHFTGLVYYDINSQLLYKTFGSYTAVPSAQPSPTSWVCLLLELLVTLEK